MKVKAYKVKLKKCFSITPKAHKLIAYDGSTLIIPSSCYIGEVPFSDNAHYISCWILDKHPEFQYSSKVKYNVEPKTLKASKVVDVIYHNPDILTPVTDNSIDELRR